MKAFAAMAALAVASVLLAGCGSNDGVLPDKDAQGRYVIHLTSANQFQPAKAHVPVGSTVVWVVDAGNHDVNAEDGSFSSNDGRPLDARGYPTLMGPGESFAYTFNETGRFTYWCHTHHEMGMKGLLVVE